MKKTALILSGGGLRGSYQVGALNYIAENWSLISGKPGLMKFDVVMGVSTGALNGGMVGMDKLSELNELWNLIARNGGSELYESAFLDDRGNFSPDSRKIAKMLPGASFFLRAMLKACGNWVSGKGFKQALAGLMAEELKQNLHKVRSLASKEPLLHKIEEHFSKDHFPEGTRFICGAVSLTDGLCYAAEAQNFHTDGDLVKAVAASVAMPLVWEPEPAVNFGDHEIKTLIDSGLGNVSPLGPVIELVRDDPEADYEFFIINCSNGPLRAAREESSNLVSIALRSLSDIASAEIFRRDLEHFQAINELVRQAAPAELVLRGKKLRSFSAHVIQPSGISMGAALNLEMENIMALKEKGYADAASFFQSNLK